MPKFILQTIIKVIAFCFFTIYSYNILAQNKLDLDGQLSLFSSYNPKNELEFFLAETFIPDVSYKIPYDSTSFVDFDASVNVSSSAFFHPFDAISYDYAIRPYRLWARWSQKRIECRLGLQKIDFGSSTLLRPLQWFNQMDPRDPLSLTYGVYSILGKYFFKNNANIWLWVLYGNEKTRGYDIIETDSDIPEYGGRVQLPILKGEIAFSYHHRTATFNNIEYIPENRLGIDGKWDLGIGLWFETSYSKKEKDVEIYTNQLYNNIGVDYTFAIGNGLNVVLEHLITSFDKNAFGFHENISFSALNINYLLNFFNRINAISYYDWRNKEMTWFISHNIQYKIFDGYIMFYYNPSSQIGVQENELVNNFEGAGINVMLVYNF